jgi:hypothetical protein
VLGGGGCRGALGCLLSSSVDVLLSLLGMLSELVVGQLWHVKLARMEEVPIRQVGPGVVLRDGEVGPLVGTNIFHSMLHGSRCARSHTGLSGQCGCLGRGGISSRPSSFSLSFAVVPRGVYGRSML